MVSEPLTEFRRHQLGQGMVGSDLGQRAVLRVAERASDPAPSADVVLTGVFKPKTEAEQTVDDLAMLVRKLVRKLPKDAELRVQALDYLSRKGLMGSPLR